MPAKLTQEQVIENLVQENNKVEPKYKVKRQDTPVGRVYRYNDGADQADIYSVTTVMNVIDKGIGFHKWLGNSPSYELAMDYGNKRAELGTMVHAFCSMLSWGMDVNTANGWEDRNFVKHSVPDEAKKRLLGFIDYFNTERPIMLASEIMLFNPKMMDNDLQYPFAGTADMIYLAAKDDKPTVVLCDIKTGKEYPKQHALQLTAYKILWDSLYGDEQGNIDALKCLYLRDNGKYKLVEYPFVPEAFYDCVSMFEYMTTTMKTGKWPTIKDKVELPTVFSLNMGEDNE
tara:strand:- start:11161 stop:12021 length:861 start_codon:yes stop_codon:yes gene_type:complete